MLYLAFVSYTVLCYVILDELSSATEIARWNWVQRPNRFRMSLVPTVPLDDYHRQMQALNGLIVARTGLPLYDLRAESAPGWQRTLIPDPSRRLES